MAGGSLSRSHVLICSCVDKAVGRAIAVGRYGNFDLRDDSEGLDGGVEVLDYYRTGAFGKGMHGFRDVLGGRVFDEEGRPVTS